MSICIHIIYAVLHFLFLYLMHLILCSNEGISPCISTIQPFKYCMWRNIIYYSQISYAETEPFCFVTWKPCISLWITMQLYTEWPIPHTPYHTFYFVCYVATVMSEKQNNGNKLLQSILDAIRNSKTILKMMGRGRVWRPNLRLT